MTQQSHRQGELQSLPRRSRARRRALLALVGAWMLLLALAVGAQQLALASPGSNTSRLFPLATTSPTNTPPGTTPTPTHGTKATPTNTVGVTPSPTSPGGSPTPTVTPTSPPTGGGGNGNGSGNGGGVTGPGGPDATKVALAQPTIGIDNSGGGGITPSSLGSQGMLIATGLSCITALLGIIIAVVALLTLLQGGYGPFLRALALGKRAAETGATGKGSAKDGKSAGKNAGRNANRANQRGTAVGDGTLRWQNDSGRSGALNTNGRHNAYDDDWDSQGTYDDGGWDSWDAPQRGGSRADTGRSAAYSPRSNGGLRNSPSSRSRRDDW